MELLNYLFCDMFGGILECYVYIFDTSANGERLGKMSFLWRDFNSKQIVVFSWLFLISLIWFHGAGVILMGNLNVCF